MIGPGAAIGDDCVVHAHVSIRERVQIGHRVILQDGAVIGSDGFGFVKQADGTHLKIPQHADVVIEDDVEIGANTTIDRPAVGETRIAAGTKIDNLVQIAHGVTVGQRVLFAAQVGIAGSTVVEDDVVLAGQVGVAGHLRIGKGVVATAQTGVPNSVDAGAIISGYPAIPNRDWLKSSAVFRQLPALKKRVAELEQRLAELEEKLEACRTPSDRSFGARRWPRASPCSLIAPAAAQQPQGIAEAPPARRVPLALRLQHVGRQARRTTIQRFTWDTHWGGDFDLVDYVHGRVTFLADYQALLGSEFRPFDPYQSNYTLEAIGLVPVRPDRGRSAS